MTELEQHTSSDEELDENEAEEDEEELDTDEEVCSNQLDFSSFGFSCYLNGFLERLRVPNRAQSPGPGEIVETITPLPYATRAQIVSKPGSILVGSIELQRMWDS